MSRTFSRLFAVVLFMFLVVGVHAQYVQNLVASPSDIGKVKVQWLESSANTPEGYILYWKYFSSSTPMLPLDSFAFQPGIYSYQKEYTIAPFSGNRDDTIVVTVRAYKNHQSTPDVGTTSVVHYHGLNLTTNPKDTAYVGVIHFHQCYLWKESFVPSSVKTIIKLEQGPSGMTIDTATTKVVWTPTQEGDFPVLISLRTDVDTLKYKVERLSYFVHVSKQDSAPVYIVIQSKPNTSAYTATQYIYSVNAKLAGPLASKFTPSFFFKLEPSGSGIYPTGMTVSSTGYIQWTPSAVGDYSFKIRLQLRKDTTIQAVQQCSIRVTKVPPTLLITKFPGSAAVRNQEYGEQMQAKFVGDSSGLRLRYRLQYGPPGMIVNSTTGHVLWTPTRNGDYEYRMLAYIQEYPEVTAPMWNHVVVGNAPAPCSYLIFTVTDTKGAIVNGTCTAWKIDETTDTNQNAFRNSTESGYFVLALTSGDYKVQFTSDVFKEVWYSSKIGPADAQVIHVNCPDTINLKMTVPLLNSDSMTITGMVRSDNNEIVPGANIQFLGYDNPFSLAQVVSTTTTSLDDNGQYRVAVDPRYNYIARVTTSSDYYRSCFSGNALDFTEALRVEPRTQSTLDLSVKSSAPKHIMHIYSNAYSTSGFPITSTMIFTRLDESTGSDKVVSIPPQFGSSHEAFQMSAGSYALLCIPDETRHVPMFSNKGTATLDWTESNSTFSDESKEQTYDVNLTKELLQQDGACHVYGTIRRPSRTGTDPVPGALIYILNAKHEVLSYAFSDTKGQYDCRGIANGSYELWIMKVGIKPTKTTISVNMLSAIELNKDYVLDSPVGVDSESNDISQTTLRIVPNPVTNIMSLFFSAPVGAASLSIIDALGRTVSHQHVDCVEGTNQTAFTLSLLPVGMYTVRLEDVTSVRATTFVKCSE